jgi:hypothetical protein
MPHGFVSPGVGLKQHATKEDICRLEQLIHFVEGLSYCVPEYRIVRLRYEVHL